MFRDEQYKKRMVEYESEKSKTPDTARERPFQPEPLYDSFYTEPIHANGKVYKKSEIYESREFRAILRHYYGELGQGFTIKNAKSGQRWAFLFFL